MGFQFLSQDVFEVCPVVKHSLPFLPFAEGCIVEIKAKVHTYIHTYILTYNTDTPAYHLPAYHLPTYLPVSESVCIWCVV